MLRDLESALGDLGIASYGLSVTTLEEVFLLLAEQGEAPGAAGGARGGAGGGGGGGSDSEEEAPRDGLGEGGAAQGQGPEAAAAAAGAEAAKAGQGGAPGGGAGDLTAPLLPKGPGAVGGGGGGGAPPGAARGERLRGWRLYLHQLRALTIKRALCARCGFGHGA